MVDDMIFREGQALSGVILTEIYKMYLMRC